MRRLILVLLVGAAASPVLAQQSGHSQTAPVPAAAASCTPEHAAMGHCTMPATAPQPPAAPPTTCTAEHAGMGHCTMAPATPAPKPAATCTPEHAAMGHCQMSSEALAQPSMQADPHARHSLPAPGSCTPEHAAMGHCSPSAPAEIAEAPPPPEAFVGPAHAQDLFFDEAAAARSRAQLAKEHGGLKAYRFLVDRLEASMGKGQDGYAWDAQFWYGGDINKLWLTSEGEGDFGGELEDAEVQALWSHAIDPWFDLQAGVRQDLRTGHDRTHLVLGVQGLAPYWFEVAGTMFLSNKGDFTARAELEYDLRITQSLILQPRGELDFSFQDVRELEIGSGFSSAELGARLRYELFPRTGPAVVAPYIGVQYERAFGDTARLRRTADEEVGGWGVLVGVRTWF